MNGTLRFVLVVLANCFWIKLLIKIREIDYRKLETIVKNEDPETSIPEPRKRKPGNQEALDKVRMELDLLIKIRSGQLSLD